MEDNWSPLLGAGVVIGVAIDVGVVTTIWKLDNVNIVPTVFSPDLKKLTRPQITEGDTGRDWR